MFSRRAFTITALSLLGSLAFGAPVVAQNFPTGPVKLIVTTGAGGAPDVIARIVADALSRHWNQQVYVTNHPGAAGAIGIKVAGTAPPDGHTLMFALSSTFVALPEILSSLPFDLVRDFIPIGFVVEQPMAIAVSPALGVSTLAELIGYVKQRPDQVNVAVLSRGGIPHLTAEWIKTAAGLNMTAINYPGTPQGLNDLMGGRVQVIMDGLPSLAGGIEGGTLKLIAVGSENRLPNLPNVPTIAETLPGIFARGFFAIMAPPRTPEALARKISEDLNSVMAEPAMKKKLEGIASYTQLMTPAELLAYVRKEQQLWKPVIEQVGLKKP